MPTAPLVSVVRFWAGLFEWLGPEFVIAMSGSRSEFSQRFPSHWWVNRLLRRLIRFWASLRRVDGALIAVVEWNKHESMLITICDTSGDCDLALFVDEDSLTQENA